jgi:hypothetical protein
MTSDPNPGGRPARSGTPDAGLSDAVLCHHPAMRVTAVAGLLGALIAMAACDALPAGIATGGSLQCDGTERAVCGAVAELAIAQMNRTATGLITAVALTNVDCVQAARAAFRFEIRSGTRCWTVDVTGDRSRGGGVVAQFGDGTMRAYWR